MIINKMINNEQTLIVIQEAPEPEEDVPMLPAATTTTTAPADTTSDAADFDDDADFALATLNNADEQRRPRNRKKADPMSRILGLNPNFATE